MTWWIIILSIFGYLLLGYLFGFLIIKSLHAGFLNFDEYGFIYFQKTRALQIFFPFTFEENKEIFKFHPDKNSPPAVAISRYYCAINKNDTTIISDYKKIMAVVFGFKLFWMISGNLLLFLCWLISKTAKTLWEICKFILAPLDKILVIKLPEHVTKNIDLGITNNNDEHSCDSYDFNPPADENEIIKRLVNLILVDAIHRKTKFVYFGYTQANHFSVSMLLNDKQTKMMLPPPKYAQGIINYLKTLANLDLLIKSKLQSGTFSLLLSRKGRTFHLETSYGIFGEYCKVEIIDPEEIEYQDLNTPEFLIDPSTAEAVTTEDHPTERMPAITLTELTQKTQTGAELSNDEINGIFEKAQKDGQTARATMSPPLNSGRRYTGKDPRSLYGDDSLTDQEKQNIIDALNDKPK
ncbi:MAG: hypothetical protein WCT18_01775 [Patescibacteria group bacterium]